jgi:hypothetical protein
MMHSQYEVTCSRSVIQSPLGIPTSSVKKIKDESNKKRVSTGPNSMLPSGDNRERGNPHAHNRGNEKSVINNWI